jgi:hypothetical protein
MMFGDKAYNAEDSFWRKKWDWATDEAAAARECGGIRVWTIETLIQRGILPANYVDTNQ